MLLGALAFTSACYSILAIPLAAEFRPDRMTLMLAMTVLSGSGAVLAPLVGHMMDRLSLRTLMIAGSLAMAGGYAALSFVTSFFQVLLVYGLIIAPANVMLGSMAATVLLARWFVRRRGAAIGIALTGVSVASIIYPPITQWLLDHNEWRVGFRYIALMLLVATLPAALLVVNRPSDRNLHPDGATAPPPESARSAASKPVSIAAILTDRSFWLAAATFAIVLSGMKGLITSLAPIVIDRGLRATDAAMLLSLYGVCGLISKLAFAGVADRFGPRKMLIASLTGFAVGMACFSQAALGPVMMILGVALTGLFGGLMMPLQSMILPRIFGEQVGRAMGLVGIVTFSALLLAPPAFGRIFDTTGSYTAIFFVFMGLALAALLALPWLRLDPKAAVRGGQQASDPQLLADTDNGPGK